jgi:uncharacterized membrane protein YgcG
MKRLGALVLGLAIALAPTATVASTDGFQDRQVDRWDVTYTLQPNGSADVVLEMDFNFGDNPGRGPYWTFPTQVPYDDTYLREYEYSDFRASSPTGAPANVYLDQTSSWIEVRVGDENNPNISGVQTYVLEYTVSGVMNATTSAELDAGGGDEVVGEEFYWNAIGDGWSTPISDVSVTVLAAVAADQYACFAGAFGTSGACDDAQPSADGVVFSQARLEPGQPMTVVVLYPPGNFDTAPQLIVANEIARAFAVNPLTVGLAGAGLVGGLVLVWRRIRTSAVDEQYAGLTPGLAPSAFEDSHVQPRDYNAPVSVQFAPPPGLRPGQLGTLIDEQADPRDVTATMVDLAVRGYMRIEEAGETGSLFSKQPDFRLVKLREVDGAMVEYERSLFLALFGGRDEVTLSDLKTTFASHMASVQGKLYQDVTAMGWFRGNPATRRATWAAGGVLLLVAGVIGIFVLANFGAGIVPLALIVLGGVVLATTRNAPARTAEGTRMLAETRGFERFLSTADGNQLRFEEGHDVFSQYLPFAIAFGVADKWAKIFEELARQGVDLPEPTWYGGVAYGTFWMHSAGFGDRMSQFATIADSAMAAPTPGSSGGSGFSGGGGSSGGGGGGGGGGGW